MAKIPELRPSPIAGRWYEGDPQALTRQVDAFLSHARLPELKGEVVALIAPHAGHIYSGRTAGYAFRCVQGKSYARVAVISPLHRGLYSDPLLTTAHQAYQTPLGALPVDRPALDALETALQQESGLGLKAVSFDEEHSVEIELPFLQRALAGEFKLLPVMIHSQDPKVSAALGRALAQVIHSQPDKSTLLVASTDLSHFFTEEEAARLDNEMLRQIAAFSPEGVYEAEFSGKGSACGVAAVAAVLVAAKLLGGTRVEVLHHSTSGDVTGDHLQVVGYGAAVVLKIVD
jgi:AmmeMemoRadiSam system protein B